MVIVWPESLGRMLTLYAIFGKRNYCISVIFKYFVS